MDTVIRPARDEDVPALMEMGRAFNTEAGYAELIPFDEKSFYKTLEVLAQAGLLLVSEKDGVVTGMAAADIARPICNHSVLIAREVFWYVKVEHRDGTGRKMLKALERRVKDLGARMFDVVAESGHRSSILGKLYSRQQFALAEHTYRKVF